MANHLTPSPDFEEMLQENLALYTSSSYDGPDIFQATREIAIARFALSQQAMAYAKAVEILTSCMEANFSSLQSNPRLLSDIMVAINSIETRSQSLIESVQKVTNLLGTAVNIDVDKAALRSMLLKLPSLVKDAINHHTNDSSLAEDISANLSSRITSFMVALRFDDSPAALSPSSQQSQQGITYEQYSHLISSVPTQPH